MADIVVYNEMGALQCVLRSNADGSQTSFGPGTSLWPDYIAKNGTPPPTGSPTFPAPAPTPEQVLLASVKTMTPAQITAQLTSIIQAMAKRLN